MTTANKITILRIALIPFFMFFLLSGMPWGDIAAFIVFILAAASDKLDGYIARKYDQITDFGKLTDPLADKLLVLSAIVIFVARGQMPAVAAAVILAREFAVSSLRVVAIQAGILMAAGIWGKIKTAVQMVGIILILALPAINALFPVVPLALTAEGLSWLMAAAALVSGAEYFYSNRALFKNTGLNK